MNQNTQKTNSR